MSKSKQIHTLHLLLLTLCLCLPSTGFALKTDKNQPIYVEADGVDLDDKKGISIYKGNVVLTQGSIVLKADKLVVTQKKSKKDHIEATGKPVTFQQQVEGKKAMVKGRARKVDYASDSEILYLTGGAVLTQGKDTFKSDKITYDRARAVVKAGASAKGSARVRVTIGGKK